MKTIFPYGAWPSAISAELVARASPAIDQPSFDCHPDRATHADQPIYWLQSQPENNGRNTVFCLVIDEFQAAIITQLNAGLGHFAAEGDIMCPPNDQRGHGDAGAG